MPIYEYQCKTCGHRFERIQSFSEPELTECPQCKGAVERLLTAPAVQFKGSGFYQTDYVRKSGGSSSSSSSSEGSSSSSSSSSDKGSSSGSDKK